MAFKTVSLKTYGISAVTYTATGAADISEVVAFEQDAEILSVFAVKPSGGASTLSVTIAPDPTSLGNPSLTLGNLSLGASDTTAQFQDPTPLKSGARLTLATTGGVAGDKGITIYARVLPGRGRGL